MTDVRKFPAEATRVESGPIQFGDDWPGVFIRGDNALFFASYIDHAIKGGIDQEIRNAMLRGLRDTLLSCSVGDTGWPP